MSVNSAVTSYQFGVTRQAAPRPYDRNRATVYASTTNPKTRFFTVVDAKPKENPSEFTLEMAGELKEKVTVTKDKPYSKVDGYMADLHYDPETRKWSGVRLNDEMRFAGDVFKVLDIKSDEIVFVLRINDESFSYSVYWYIKQSSICESAAQSGGDDQCCFQQQSALESIYVS